MRAVAMLDHKLHLRELPVPVPGPGEVLVKTLACGICGSDLHALRHTEKLVESARRAGGAFVMDTKRDVVMGHEFCAEIADYGPGTPKRFAPGTRVCAMPILVQATGVSTVGYSNDAPGGYGEYMRLMEPLLLPVPASLSTDHAALTEPMAVGLHAVKKAKLERDRRAAHGGRPPDRRRRLLAAPPRARPGDGRRRRRRPREELTLRDMERHGRVE